MSRSKRRFSCISLFSGAMGLDLGLERAGFEVRACVEMDPIACETIRLNRPGLPLLQEDVRELTAERLLRTAGLRAGEVDLVAGGPPCQPYSTAGRRRTVNDPRGALFKDFVRLVAEIRPRLFLLENVRGILSAAVKHRPLKERGRGHPPLSRREQPGSVVAIMLREFEKVGYRVDYFAVNAVNYGAPQLRERAIFIGNRFGLVTDFPEPTHAADPTGHRRPFRTLGDALRGFKDRRPVLLDFSPRKKRYLSFVPPGGNWRHMPPKIQRESMGKAYYAKGGRSGWWRRLSYGAPCPTIVTMPNHAGTSLCHPEEVRVLSVRECAQVQEFPKRWHFAGNPAQQHQQVGNAVPTRLGEVAGRVIASQLRLLGRRRQLRLPLEEEAAPSRGKVILSTIRTRRYWRRDVGVIWDGVGPAPGAAP